MLKRLKECLHQQKNVVIYKLGASPRNTKLIAFWTCALKSWCTIQHTSETESSSSFPWTWKKKKYLQACQDQRRHFSPFVVAFMWCSAWKWSQGSTSYKTLQKGSPRNQESLILKLKLHEVKNEQCNVDEPHIYAFEDHVSSQAEWANTPSGKLEPASACSYHDADYKRTVSQNWQWTKLLGRKTRSEGIK